MSELLFCNRVDKGAGLLVLGTAAQALDLGVAALLGQTGAAGKPVTATDLSFSLIPRLNAAGRLGDAQIALDLLMTDAFDTACKLAAELEATNDKRRAIQLPYEVWIAGLEKNVRDDIPTDVNPGVEPEE